jgi:hypothetical protein
MRCIQVSRVRIVSVRKPNAQRSATPPMSWVPGIGIRPTTAERRRLPRTARGATSA